MAIEQDILAADLWFAGEDKVLEFEVLQADETTPEDVSAWTFAWAMRKKASDAGAPMLEQTTADGITVVGIYDATRELNTQRVRVALDADASRSLKAPYVYWHALKRTDAGNEAVLAFGQATLLAAATH